MYLILSLANRGHSLFGLIAGRGPIACWFQRTLLLNRAGKEARAEPRFYRNKCTTPLDWEVEVLERLLRRKQSDGLGGDPSFCLHHLCTALIFFTCVFWSSKVWAHFFFERNHRIYQKIGSIHSTFFGPFAAEKVNQQPLECCWRSNWTTCYSCSYNYYYLFIQLEKDSI